MKLVCPILEDGRVYIVIRGTNRMVAIRERSS